MRFPSYRRLALAASTIAVTIGVFAIPASASASTLYTKDGVAVDVPVVWVGNTDSEGVFVRKTPVLEDRLTAYPDNTVLVTIGPDVDGDGTKWHQVRTPDGVEGYVPVQYTVTAPTATVTAAPAPPTALPAPSVATVSAPGVTSSSPPPATTVSSGVAVPAATGYGEISKTTGLPRTDYVSGYTRRDGTYVQPYYRSHR